MEGTAGSDSSTHLDCIHVHGPTSCMGRWNRQLTDTKSVLAPPVLQLSQYISAQHFSSPSWWQFNSPTQQKIASFFTYSVLFWLSESKCLVTDPVRTRTKGRGRTQPEAGGSDLSFQEWWFFNISSVEPSSALLRMNCSSHRSITSLKSILVCKCFFSLCFYLCVYKANASHLYSTHIID